MSGAPRGARGFRALTLWLLVPALVLGYAVLQVVVWPDRERVEPGAPVALRTAPYGTERTVTVPGAVVSVVVGPPTTTLPFGLLDYDYGDPRYDEELPLEAPEGGTLVPLSWSVRSTTGLAGDPPEEPVEVALEVADTTVRLGTVTLADSSSITDASGDHPLALAIDRPAGLDDATLAVTFDGLTQRVDIASGARDAGVADIYYDDSSGSFTAGCTEVFTSCFLRAADPESPLRPSSDTFTLSYLSLYPYDSSLGWAPEGHLWAGVQLQAFGSDSVRNAQGRSWYAPRMESVTVRLDGVEPVQVDGLKPGPDLYGRVVFEVDAGARPQEIEVAITHALETSAPQPTLDVAATLELAEVG